MITINANALRLTLAKLQTVRKTTVKKGDAGFRQKLYYLFEEVLKVSPQFTGDFVSNWQLVVDGNLGTYKAYIGKTDAAMRETLNGEYRYKTIAPHQAGDLAPITSALARGRSRLNGVTMKSTVQFINLTDLYTDGQNMISPRDSHKLRPENVIPGNVRIESYIRALAKNPPPLKKEPL